MKKKNKLSKLLTMVLIIVSIIFMVSLMALNVLTIYYLFIIIAIVGILDFVVIILMHRKRKSIFGKVFGVFITIILGLGSFYLLKTNNVLMSFNKNYKTYNYSVVVLKNSNYDKLADIADQTMGYYKTDGEECQKSLEELENKVSITKKSYTDLYGLAEGLLNGKVEAMLIEDAYLNILKESDNVSGTSINNFEDQIKVIYTYNVRINISDISKDVNVLKEPFNIYISGIDTYGSVSSVSRSDVNMIATINPNTRQILLTSIPRDYYVALHGVSGYRDKLTHAGLYGVDMSIKTIEDLLDIKINYYVKVNFTSVIDIVDAVGGVNVYSDYSFTSIDGYNYSKGYNSVNGKEALSFVRERKAFSEGDRQRIKNQQALIEALFRKCTSKDIIVKYNSLLNSLSNSFVTNIPTDRLTSLIKMQLSKNYSWTITSNSLTGTDSSNYTYSIASQKSYVMEPDEDSIIEASDFINAVIDGEKLESSYDGDVTNVHTVTQNKTTTNNSSTNNSSPSNDSDTSSSNSNNEGLEAKLIKSSICFVTGDDYIYHGFNATYNGKDVTDVVDVTFSVSGAVFDNYPDLVRYVSSLNPGNYIIIYNISYQDETAILKQDVTIEELLDNSVDNKENNTDEEDKIIEDDDMLIPDDES